MKRYLILLSLILMACSDKLPCPKDDETSKPGIYSKPLGMVTIDGETCQIFETYEKFNCTPSNRTPDWGGTCEGSWTYCQWKILTRVTKCPSQTTTNSVTQTGGKYSHEEVH